MVDWRSPAELQKQAVAFSALMHALFGLYVWEFCNSFDFEWDLITQKRKFKWPFFFYFAGRYSMLSTLVGVIIALDTVHPINCQALYTINSLTGNATIGLASINLAIRTMAIWRQNKYIIGFLVVLIIGHWSVILQGVIITAVWSPEVMACVITKTSNTVLAAIFIYGMVFDGLVLGLCAYKLIGTGLVQKKIVGSQIGRLLFRDGLIYFIIAFLSSSLATVFVILHLSEIMSVIFNVPAVVASTIVASRAVRRLSNFIYDSGGEGSEVTRIRFTSDLRRVTGDEHTHHLHPRTTTANDYDDTAVKAKNANAVHVQMETFSRVDEGLEDESDSGFGTVKGGE